MPTGSQAIDNLPRVPKTSPRPFAQASDESVERKRGRRMAIKEPTPLLPSKEPKKIREAMGNEFKRARIERKWSQTDVARYLGINRTTYSSYESGTSEPSLTTGLDICKLLGVGIERIHQSGDLDN